MEDNSPTKKADNKWRKGIKRLLKNRKENEIRQGMHMSIANKHNQFGLTELRRTRRGAASSGLPIGSSLNPLQAEVILHGPRSGSRVKRNSS